MADTVVEMVDTVVLNQTIREIQCHQGLIMEVMVILVALRACHQVINVMQEKNNVSDLGTGFVE